MSIYLDFFTSVLYLRTPAETAASAYMVFVTHALVKICSFTCIHTTFHLHVRLLHIIHSIAQICMDGIIFIKDLLCLANEAVSPNP